jgi:hypothetical protein
MNRKASLSSLTALVCALGGAVPASATPFEELMQLLQKMKTEPHIEMAVRLAKENPLHFHLLGHNLGEGEAASVVQLHWPGVEAPLPLASQWLNSQHLLAALPEEIEAKDQARMQLAVAVAAKDGGPAGGKVSAKVELLPARRIDGPMDLIQAPTREVLHRMEAFDTKAVQAGLGSMQICFEYTQGHENNLVARAFGLTPAQVAQRIRQLETKAAPDPLAPLGM